MPKANAVREAPFDAQVAASRAAESSGSLAVPGLGLWSRLRALVERLTDAQLALAVSVTLFAVTAWPLLLVEVPPYQDLPNHLAAATIINHPALGRLLDRRDAEVRSRPHVGRDARSARRGAAFVPRELLA
jgi:hypothetical protein